MLLLMLQQFVLMNKVKAPYKYEVCNVVWYTKTFQSNFLHYHFQIVLIEHNNHQIMEEIFKTKILTKKPLIKQKLFILMDNLVDELFEEKLKVFSGNFQTYYTIGINNFNFNY